MAEPWKTEIYSDPEDQLTFSGVPLDINERNPSNTNALLTTGFRFLLTRTPNITYFCQSVNLPDINLGEMEQPTPFVPIKRPGNSFTYGDLDISFIVDENMENWREIHNWMRSLKNIDDYEEVEGNPTYHFSDARLMLLNSSMTANLEVEFKDIFPKSLSGINFTSSTDDTEPVICNATFAFTSYDIRKIWLIFSFSVLYLCIHIGVILWS